MPKTNVYLPLIPLFQKYISEAKSQRRFQKNGKIISNASIHNYEALKLNLIKFSKLRDEIIQFNLRYRYSKRNFDTERRHYQKFYKNFTDYLYTKNCTDNYVGSLIKTLRSFFIYLNEVKGCETGLFYKVFYVRREEIPVIVLSQEQLKFLINNDDFSNSLAKHIRVSKDIFVLGCTVGLRFSDLINLRKRNLNRVNNKTYLISTSSKTDTETRIKLPDYAIEILQKYKGGKQGLLPKISLNQFNANIKKIAFLAGWTYEVGKERSKRGVRKEIKKDGKTYRFCDLASSHMMRRTAITTLLILGMPEPLVRKISGHAANSKEFYKYVKYSESFLDTETDKAFERLLNSGTT